VLSLTGEAAWWIPGWLDRVLPHVDSEGASLGDPATTRSDKIPA